MVKGESKQMKYEEILKVHIAVFGKTLARIGMREEYEYVHEYVLYLISHEGLRWMMDRYIEEMKADKININIGDLLDKFTEEYDNYLVWIEEKKEQVEKQK